MGFYTIAINMHRNKGNEFNLFITQLLNRFTFVSSSPPKKNTNPSFSSNLLLNLQGNQAPNILVFHDLTP